MWLIRRSNDHTHGACRMCTCECETVKCLSVDRNWMNGAWMNEWIIQIEDSSRFFNYIYFHLSSYTLHPVHTFVSVYECGVNWTLKVSAIEKDRTQQLRWTTSKFGNFQYFAHIRVLLGVLHSYMAIVVEQVPLHSSGSARGSCNRSTTQPKFRK